MNRLLLLAAEVDPLDPALLWPYDDDVAYRLSSPPLRAVPIDPVAETEPLIPVAPITRAAKN